MRIVTKFWVRTAGPAPFEGEAIASPVLFHAHLTNDHGVGLATDVINVNVARAEQVPGRIVSEDIEIKDEANARVIFEAIRAHIAHYREEIVNG